MLKLDKQPFSNIFGVTASSVLTDFLSTEEIVDIPIEYLIRYICEKRHNWFPKTEDTSSLLKQAAPNFYRLDKCLWVIDYFHCAFFYFDFYLSGRNKNHKQNYRENTPWTGSQCLSMLIVYSEDKARYDSRHLFGDWSYWIHSISKKPYPNTLVSYGVKTNHPDSLEKILPYLKLEMPIRDIISRSNQ